MSDYRKSVSGRISGTVSLASGVDSGTAVVALGSVPERVLLTMESPAGGDTLYPVLMDTRSNGFDFELSGETPAAGYKLHYICDF